MLVLVLVLAFALVSRDGSSGDGADASANSAESSLSTVISLGLSIPSSAPPAPLRSKTPPSFDAAKGFPRGVVGVTGSALRAARFWLTASMDALSLRFKAARSGPTGAVAVGAGLKGDETKELREGGVRELSHGFFAGCILAAQLRVHLLLHARVVRREGRGDHSRSAGRKLGTKTTALNGRGRKRAWTCSGRCQCQASTV